MKVNSILTSVFSLSLLTLLSCDLHTPSNEEKYLAELEQFLTKANETKLEVESRRLFELHLKYDRPEKYKFSSALDALGQLSRQVASYNEERKKKFPDAVPTNDSAPTVTLSKVIALNEIATLGMNELMDYVETDFLKNYELYGYTRDQAESKLAALSAEMLEVDSIQSKYVLTDKRVALQMVSRMLFVHEMLYEQRRRIVESFVLQVAGRIYEHNYIFPVVYNTTFPSKENRIFKTNISIGDYSSSYSPEDVIIVVNGSDTIRIDDSGVAQYESDQFQTGENILPIEVYVTNRLTGYTTVGEGEYVFTVE